MFGRKRKLKQKHGGIFFLTSLVIVLFFGPLNFVNLIFQPSWLEIDRAISFCIGGITGWSLSQWCIRGRVSVLLHELKHAIPSTLVGNRWKDLVAHRESGYFQYEATEETQSYNAFIALAPYWFPLFSIVTFVVTILSVPSSSRLLRALLIGLAYGGDLRLNLRDISPVQTDLTHTRGGYPIALLYIVAMNAVVLSFVFAWGCGEERGIEVILAGLKEFVSQALGILL